MQKTNIIKIENLSRTYRSKSGEEVKAVHNIDLEVAEGQFITIIGSSGSGKTTLLNLLGGLDKPTAGKVTVDGTDLSGLKEADAVKFRREKVGFVFQAFNLIQTLTALENVEAALAPTNISRKEKLERSISLLESVGLKHRSNHLPVELSAGEQQRVAIARAFANQPKILLLDEPTGNLDTATGREIMEICHKNSKRNGQTVVAVTHADFVRDFTDRVIHMRDGRLQA
jgi:putative ABC transport system ATP-binding protein